MGVIVRLVRSPVKDVFVIDESVTVKNVTRLEYSHKLNLDVDADFLRDSITLRTRLLMEVEVSKQIGAELGERTSERQTYRNGYRDRAT